jgi:uncharacterized membrane protein YraQ (UPF0718 family)
MTDILRREAIYLWYYLDILFRQMFGYWVLGVLVGSVFSVFGKEKISGLMERLSHSRMSGFGILPAALLGAVSPLSMYGTVPVAASLLSKGMREDWVVSFMMCSILLNPQLIVYTGALGPVATVLRVVCGLLCGLLAGVLVRAFGSRGWSSASRTARPCIRGWSSASRTARPCIRGTQKQTFFKLGAFERMANRDTDPNIGIRLLKNTFRNIRATGTYFFVGILLAAVFQRYIPAEAIDGMFGRNGLGVLIAATVGVPLYACGGGNIPIISAWMGQGMTLGGAMAFMTSGQAMKITNLGAVKIILGAKHFIFYIIFNMGFAVLFGVLIDSHIFTRL